MALNNYANLKQAVMRWTHRDDIDEVLPDIIALTESDMYVTGDTLLRVREMEVLDEYLTIVGSRSIPLPDDFLHMRSLKVNGTRIESKSPDMLMQIDLTGIPCKYAITDKLIFDRIADSDYLVEMDYYCKPESLGETEQENTILTKYPNIYLYGCIFHANEFAGEEDKAQNYATRFYKAIKSANKTSKRGRYGVAPEYK